MISCPPHCSFGSSAGDAAARARPEDSTPFGNSGAWRIKEGESEKSRKELEAEIERLSTELQSLQHKLRLAERMASIGTMSAGIGHDLGNLLLPLRSRIDLLEREPLAEGAREHVAAIRSCAEYLQRLAAGLRLLSLDPDSDTNEGAVALEEWWKSIVPILRTGIARGISLDVRFEPNLPPIAIAPHRLMQLFFNLVQNAGEACQGVAGPRIRIDARLAEPRRIVLTISDNGHGMTEDVRRRCMEPFFTTKARGVSTGLGLALVARIVDDADGAIEVRSDPGKGTSFALSLPAAAKGPEPRPESALSAIVSVSHPRMQSLVASVLGALGVSIVTDKGDRFEDARILVIDGGRDDEVMTFFRKVATGCAVILGGTMKSWGARALWVPSPPAVRAVREALRTAVQRAGAGG